MTHHIHTLDESPTGSKIIYHNASLAIPQWYKYLQFDAIIYHYSFWAMRFSPWYIGRMKHHFDWLAELQAVKIAIPQDEYDKSDILDEWMRQLNISVVFSCFKGENLAHIYPIMTQKARFFYALTGYIHEKTAKEIERVGIEYNKRPRDIVYRARNLPYYMGSHGQLKHRIANVVKEKAQSHGLTTDISTDPIDTILGDKWIEFVASGRACIGVESGTSSIDRDGSLQIKVNEILQTHPNATFEEVSRQLPSEWDSYQFFAVGPRHFEAVITKTAQVLVEGDYSGIFEPNKHYIPLKRDFSNLDEVLNKLKDDTLIEEMIDRSYKDIYLNGKYTYREFARMIESSIDEQCQKKHSHRPQSYQTMWYLGKAYSQVNNLIIELQALFIWGIILPILNNSKLGQVLLRKIDRSGR